MIIFYNKTTGNIVGVIEGRIHAPDDKLWIGSREENEKLVVNWKKEEGVYMPDLDDNDQKALFIAVDKKPSIIYDFKVEVQSKKLVQK